MDLLPFVVVNIFLPLVSSVHHCDHLGDGARRGCKTDPEVIKHWPCSTQLSMKFVLLLNLKLLIIANTFLQNIAEHETIVGIFIFVSRENFKLS